MAISVTIEEYKSLATKHAYDHPDAKNFLTQQYRIGAIPRAIQKEEALTTRGSPDISFYLHQDSRLLRVKMPNYSNSNIDECVQHLIAANQSDIGIKVIGKPKKEYFEGLYIAVGGADYPTSDPQELARRLGADD